MPQHHDVFVSYASRDREKVVEIADAVASLGVTIWRDQQEILGGHDFGPRIVDAIQHCRVMLIVCSSASMASRNVQTEISLAWDSGCCYLPLLLDDSITVTYPNQVRYWLQRSQWIVVQNRPVNAWLAEVARSLRSLGIASQLPEDTEFSAHVPAIEPDRTLHGLLQTAAFTDRIWPFRPLHVRTNKLRANRDLGELPPTPSNEFRLGEWVCLRIKTDRPGYLRLINFGTSGRVYSLCPSRFAPDMRLPAGESLFPQEGSPWEAFSVTGKLGREQLLAIVTDTPLDLNWASSRPEQPARILDASDCNELVERLHELNVEQWRAEATYFDIVK